MPENNEKYVSLIDKYTELLIKHDALKTALQTIAECSDLEEIHRIARAAVEVR